MGAPKGLLSFGDCTLIEQHIQSFRRSLQAPVIVVLGYNENEYRQALQHVAHDVDWVVNPDPARGTFSSIQCGLQRSQIVAETAFILPVDMLPLADSTWSLLLNSMRNVDVVSPRFNGKSGHPLLLSNQTIKSILLMDPCSSRLDYILRGLPLEKRFWMDVEDPAVLENINTPSEWGLKQHRANIK